MNQSELTLVVQNGNLAMASANTIQFDTSVTDTTANSNTLTLTAGTNVDMNDQISIQGSAFLKANTGITARSVYAQDGVQIDADYDDNGGGDTTAQN